MKFLETQIDLRIVLELSITESFDSLSRTTKISNKLNLDFESIEVFVIIHKSITVFLVVDKHVALPQTTVKPVIERSPHFELNYLNSYARYQKCVN
ncbi:unnamed protein product [Caenorhabditis nigoni]